MGPRNRRLHQNVAQVAQITIGAVEVPACPRRQQVQLGLQSLGDGREPTRVVAFENGQGLPEPGGGPGGKRRLETVAPLCDSGEADSGFLDAGDQVLHHAAKAIVRAPPTRAFASRRGEPALETRAGFSELAVEALDPFGMEPG